jgi:CO/xanthine dehydrogenase FAD-binding subunit
MLDLTTLARPATAEEAVRAFAESEGTGLFVAGGTIVVPSGSRNLDFLVDLSGAGLDYVRVDGGELVIGAGTTISDLAASKDAAELGGGLLVRAARQVATHTVRNLATVGGNVASWPYPSDLPSALLALDAGVVIQDLNGRREVRLDVFYGERREVFRKGDLIVEVRIGDRARRLRGGYQKLGRKKLDVALVNAAVALALEGEAITLARVATNGCSASPVRSLEAERLLVGARPSAGLFAKAALTAAGNLTPKSDVRATAYYRSRIAAVAVRRALADAAGLSVE